MFPDNTAVNGIKLVSPKKLLECRAEKKPTEILNEVITGVEGTIRNEKEEKRKFKPHLI